MDWLLRQYRKRIVNVNVNIIAAGIVAIAFTNVVMYLLHLAGFLDLLKNILPDWNFTLFGKHREIHGQSFLISGLTLLVDLAADVAAYYALHWVANHMPGHANAPKSAAYAGLTFMQDASLVQFQRALLSPILYIVAIGLQNHLLNRYTDDQGNVAPSKLALATTIGYGTGILLCRCLHTCWMLIHEHRVERRLKTSAASKPTQPTPEPSAHR